MRIPRSRRAARAARASVLALVAAAGLAGCAAFGVVGAQVNDRGRVAGGAVEVGPSGVDARARSAPTFAEVLFGAPHPRAH